MAMFEGRIPALLDLAARHWGFFRCYEPPFRQSSAHSFDDDGQNTKKYFHPLQWVMEGTADGIERGRTRHTATTKSRRVNLGDHDFTKLFQV